MIRPRSKFTERVFIPACTFILFMGLAFPSGAQQMEQTTVSKAKGFKRGMHVDVINELDVPRGYHEGLRIDDGGNLWLCNGEGLNVWIIDSKDGKLLSRIKPTGRFTEMTVDIGGGKLLVSDWENKKIYHASIVNDAMVPGKETDHKPEFPAGMVYDGSNVYLITWARGTMGTRYNLLKMDTDGNVLARMKINDIPEPSQIAWDGKYLWISSWYDNHVYKVDPGTYQILGSFKSPCSKTTGIAWAGNGHFWVTGTYDNIYYIKVSEKQADT